MNPQQEMMNPTSHDSVILTVEEYEDIKSICDMEAGREHEVTAGESVEWPSYFAALERLRRQFLISNSWQLETDVSFERVKMKYYSKTILKLEKHRYSGGRIILFPKD